MGRTLDPGRALVKDVTQDSMRALPFAGNVANSFTLAMVGTAASSLRMLPQARLALSRAPISVRPPERRDGYKLAA